MRYFKTVENGYIVAIQTVEGKTEITEQEYNSILDIIHNKPIAQDGYTYRLKDNLSWELTQENESEEIDNV